MKLEEQGRLLGQRQVGIRIASFDLNLIGKLDARQRQPHLHGGDGGVARAFDGGEGTNRRQDRLGNALQLEGQLGDDAERAFGADHEAGQIVTACGFAGAGAGLEHAAVGQHGGKAQDIVAHGAVAHRVGARGAGRRHAAETRIGTGIDGKEQATIA